MKDTSLKKPSFYVIGISYKNADLETRGKFSLSDEQVGTLLIEAKSEGIEEMLVNSTCNRTEIYAYASHPYQLIKLLCAHSKGSLEVFESIGYIFKNQEAFHHIFKVGTGLDSQILGDFEIIGQLRRSFSKSRELGLVGGFMERLINFVIQASKRIKTETPISSGATSISFASVRYILEKTENTTSKNILLFGTGKIGYNTCENLIKHTENNQVVLINRTYGKAEKIAKKFNVIVKPQEDLIAEIEKTDILIVSTGAKTHTVLKEMIKTKKPLLILDLSTPKNVNEDVKDLENVSLINLDELSQMTDETLKERKKHIPKAEKIIEEIKVDFYEWLNHRQFVPVLRAFKNKLKEQQEAEIREYKKKKREEGDIAIQSHISNQMIQKITGQVANYLKENPSKSNEVLDVIQDVFRLEKTSSI